MVVSCLLMVMASILAFLLLQRLLREGSARCLITLSPLLGSLGLILVANWLPHAQRAQALAAFTGLCLPLLFLKRPASSDTPLCRPVKICLGLSLLFVLGYTHYAQLRFVDTDNWIHEPMIASYMRGVFPPVHPFFPDIPMHGHYGRDLLVSFLTPELADPLGTVWCLNLLLQACSFLGLFCLGQRFSGRSGESVGLAVCIFFGICVGVRTGMVDTFDGNNGVVYALLVPLLYLLGRVLDWSEEGNPGVAVCLIAGLALGTYQLVYESHFGLLFLTGLSLAAVFERRPRIWAGLLGVALVALSLACVEGGPFTDIAQRKFASQGLQEHSEAAQNKGQHVTLSFPKKDLFKVMVTTADYQRMSVAYTTKLFSALRPRLSGEGYMAIYDPRFLYAHWLPLYLCPFVFWLLWRDPQAGYRKVGLAFWFFGAWAYLVPALVDFGALYEFEYFRWEFAAGWGWAGAFGLAVTSGLRTGKAARPHWQSSPEGWNLTLPRDLPRVLGFTLLLVAELAAGEKLLNDGWVEAQRQRLNLFSTPSAWRLSQKELGVTAEDRAAAAWLAPQVKKGDRLLTNLGEETPGGIWPDCVWASWTGTLPAGRAHPPEGSRHHAHPNFYRDALAKAFNQTGRLDLLQLGGVRWLVVDPSRLDTPAREKLASDTSYLRHKIGDLRWVYELPPMALPPSGPQLTATGQLEGADPAELRRGRRYPVKIKLRSPSAPAGPSLLTARVLSANSDIDLVTPLRLLSPPVDTGAVVDVEHSLVTPWEEGNFLWVLEQDGKRLAEIPFRVDLEKRLTAIRGRLDLPDSFQPKHFYSLRLGLTSSSPIHAAQELTLYWRLRHQGGDYVWDLDSIPQNLPFELEPEQENIFSLQFLTPAQSGIYIAEIYIKDRATGAEVPLKMDSAQIRIP